MIFQGLTLTYFQVTFALEQPNLAAMAVQIGK